MPSRPAIAALLVAVMIAATLQGAGAPPIPRAAPESVGLSASSLRDATELLRSFVTDRQIAGAVAAVARHGRVAYLDAVGFQDIAARSEMSERSLFRIYSMTKSVTAVAVMMLWEEGRFTLTDEVSRYLPEFEKVQVGGAAGGSLRPPARAITVEDLLLHTSGLNHRTSEVYRRAHVRSRSIALPQFVINIVGVPLMEDPGTRYRYSEGTTVLGRLVEVWSGKPFDVFLDERLFRPLQLADTAFSVGPADRTRLTTVYETGPDGLVPLELEAVPFTERPPLLEGAAGLVSTVPDYLRFAQMLLNKGELDGVRLLKPATVEMMTTNRLPEPIVRARGGVGWALLNVNVVLDPATFNYPSGRDEYGWDGSAGTIFWIDPHLDMLTVLMTQSSPPNPDNLRQRFKTIVQRAIRHM